MRVLSSTQLQNGGYWHPYESSIVWDPPRRNIEKEKYVVPDFAAMLSAWRPGFAEWNQRLATELKLSISSLNDLGTVYSKPHKAYAFPMFTPDGKVVGIRLRNDRGKKWAVRGSQAGLFIPITTLVNPLNRDLFICEGPTDTAAALTLGLSAIGRHACVGQEEMVAQFIKIKGVKHAYICCDNDEPGLRGAHQLKQHLKCKTTMFIPAMKDLREFLIEGGTKELLFSSMSLVL